MEPLSMEKQSLEAHVDLCAMRYQALDLRLNKLENSIGKVESMISEVHEMVEAIDQRHNERIIGWGISIIGAMTGIIGWLIVNYVVK